MLRVSALPHIENRKWTSKPLSHVSHRASTGRAMFEPAEPNKISSVRRRSQESLLPVAKGTKSISRKAVTKKCEFLWQHGFDLSLHPDWPPTADRDATQR